MEKFHKAIPTDIVSPEESVRLVRELQELSQSQLSDFTGIPVSTIEAIETGQIKLDIEHTKTLARALKCHPAVLLFPGWDIDKESAA